VVTTIFSESTPTARRALFITFGMAWMIVGWVLGGVIPTLLVPHYGWRVCYLIGGVPFLYAVFLHFRMRESAYWLANKGRKKEAVEILAYIENQATGKITPRDPNAIVVPRAPRVVGPKSQFSKDYRMITAGLWITYFCGCFNVYGLSAWLPSLMLEKGFMLTSAYALAIANNAAAVIANCSTGFVAEIIGRRPNLIISYLLGGFSIVLMAFVSGGFTAILAASIFMGFAVNYAITAVQPLMAEAYPTEFRNTGVSWCQAFGRVGGALAPIVAGAIMGMQLGLKISFLFYVIPAVSAPWQPSFRQERDQGQIARPVGPGDDLCRPLTLHRRKVKVPDNRKGGLATLHVIDHAWKAWLYCPAQRAIADSSGSGSESVGIGRSLEFVRS
jgi:MFS family permease